MEKEGEEGKNEYLSEVEKFELIDFSSEDDFLVDYPFRDSLEDLRLSVTFKNISDYNSSQSLKIANQRKVEHMENNLHQREEKMSTPEFIEPRRPSYLRKSIAWDNAFCCSAGVLDHEELSAINKGFKGQECSLFPGLPEDLKARRSADSDLTFESLDSDAFSVDSFQGELFEDVRASIYRSCGPLSLTAASCDSVIGKASTPYTHPSKKVHVYSQNKKKFDAPSKKQTTDYQKSKTMTRFSLPSPNIKHKGVCDLTPRKLGAQRAILAGQTKSVSSDIGNIKNRKTGDGLMVPKQSASVDSPNFFSLLTPPIKSSSLVTASKSSSISGSLRDSYSSTSSSKSNLSSGTRHAGSNSTSIPSSGSNSKPPLRYSGRTRSRLSNQTPPIHLPSISHHLKNSPASSADGWSSESSSTSGTTAKQKSGNLENKLRTSTNQASGLHQFTHRKMSPDQHTKGALRDASPVSAELPKSSKGALRDASPVSAELPKSSKPSGLRMPSPKIGFFDEKSMVPTSTDTLHFQFRSQNASSDPNRNTNIRGPSNIQLSRNVHGTRNSNGSLSQALHSTSSTKPQRLTQSKELDNASKKSTGMRNSLGRVLKFRPDASFEVDDSYCSKTRKVGKGEDDRKKVVLTSCLKTEVNRNKGVLKYKLGNKRKDQKAANAETMDPFKKDHEAAQELLESNLHSHCESKENFDDQVNGLSKHLEAIDLGGNATKHDGEKGNAREPIESLDDEHFLSGQQQDSPSITRIPLADKSLDSHIK